MCSLGQGNRNIHAARSLELTQVPVRDGVVVVQLIIIFVLVLDAVALVLLGDRAGAMEAWPDVLLVVWDGLVFLDVPLVQNEENLIIRCNFQKAIRERASSKTIQR